MPDSSEVGVSIADQARRAKAASRLVGAASIGARNAVLLRVAAALRGPDGDALIAANARDLDAASEARRDRFRLDRTRVDAITEGIENVAALPDPIGEIVEQRKLANGIAVGRMRVPLGLISIVYDAGSKTTAELTSYCLKSGNAVLLGSGLETMHGDRVLLALFARALRAEGLPEDATALATRSPRDGWRDLLGTKDVLDAVVVKGDESLVHEVTDAARVPVLRLVSGACHTFIDRDADLMLAERIVLEALERPFGSLRETILVDQTIAPFVLGVVERALVSKKRSTADLERSDDSERVRVHLVDDIDAALSYLVRHGTRHAEAIVTQDRLRADRWVREVDASMVLVNASPRTGEAFPLGLGVGICTTKLHAYGPMGLTDLCTLKWVAHGDGQVR